MVCVSLPKRCHCRYGGIVIPPYNLSVNHSGAPHSGVLIAKSKWSPTVHYLNLLYPQIKHILECFRDSPVYLNVPIGFFFSKIPIFRRSCVFLANRNSERVDPWFFYNLPLCTPSDCLPACKGASSLLLRRRGFSLQHARTPWSIFIIVCTQFLQKIGGIRYWVGSGVNPKTGFLQIAQMC